MRFLWLLPVLCLPAAMAQVTLTQSPDKIAVEIDGKPFGTFYLGSDANKPYFHPLRAASGTVVTRRYPMEKVEGEPHDHNHHRGLWFGHIDVNGINFWESDPLNTSDKRQFPKFGKMVLRKVGEVKSGKKSGSLKASFDWNDPDGKTVLREDRTMVFYSDPKLRIVDVDITLTATAGKVVFGDDKDGGFAVRMAAPLQEEKGSGKLTDSEGRETEKAVWGKSANWADYSGTVDGEQVGIAILPDPKNPNGLSHWHARAYGLFSANPFGRKTFDKTQAELGLTVEAGKSVRFRYRLVIHAGDAKAAGIAEMYDKYRNGRT